MILSNSCQSLLNHKYKKCQAKQNRFWRRPNSIEEEIELRKLTGKEIDNIERLETEIKEIVKTEFKSVKLLDDLNFEKRLEIDEIIKIEIRPEKLGISETMQIKN